MTSVGKPKSLEDVLYRLSLLFASTRNDDGSVTFEGFEGRIAALSHAEDGRAIVRIDSSDLKADPSTVERWAYAFLTCDGRFDPIVSSEDANATAAYLKQRNRHFTVNRLWGDLNWIEEHVRSSEQSGDWLRYVLDSLTKARGNVRTLSGMLGVAFDESDPWQPFGKTGDE